MGTEAPELELWTGLETDVGPVRDLNEDYVDSFVPVDDDQRLSRGAIFLVADGMGGHQAGEVASRAAVERVKHEYYADAAHDPGDSLVRSLKIANQILYDQAQTDPSKAGMGTTMVAAVVLGRRVYVANVGDSRAYLINEQGIGRITEDHSWVEEQVQAGLLTREQAEGHPQRNLITRALGHKPSVEVDLFKGEMREGDVLLLCSDGLSGSLSAQQMASIVYNTQTPPQAAAQLVAQAKVQHSEDNISAVVVKAIERMEVEDEAETVVRAEAAAWEAGVAPRLYLAAVRTWLQDLVDQLRLPLAGSGEQRQWLLVGLAVVVFMGCLCAAVTILPAIGQRLVGDPAAAPQQAPIRYEQLANDDPAWWADYLGYGDLEEMAGAHRSQLDLENPATVDLWPARRGVFVVGPVGDWDCQEQTSTSQMTCTFQVKMADKQYAVVSEPQFFAEEGTSLSGRRVRVFGHQEQEGSAVVARLIDRAEPWWAWWQPAWITVYRNHNWNVSVWVFGVADRNPYSPVMMDSYPDLARGDRVLVRGKWLEGGARDSMAFEAESLYRLETGGYSPVSGKPDPVPRPTVTLRSGGE